MRSTKFAPAGKFYLQEREAYLLNSPKLILIMKTKIMISQVAIRKKRLVGNNAKFMVEETALTMIAQE